MRLLAVVVTAELELAVVASYVLVGMRSCDGLLVVR